MKVKDGLYHAETGLPWQLVDRKFGSYEMNLDYSEHARQAAISDRYGIPQSVPKRHRFERAEIFEVEVEQGRVIKFCARLRDAGRTTTGNLFDLVLVCSLSAHSLNNLYVKTLWLNEPGDNHSTLDKSKYIPYAK